MSGQPDRIHDAVPGPTHPGTPGPAPTLAQRLLLAFFRLVLSTFFRRIEVVGADGVPPGGPVIFVANHPNALIDGALLLTTCGRSPVHFMCNAKLWRYPLLPRVLECLGGVPVRRAEEHQGPVDNRATFDRLFDSLESGVSIGIFPEGVSHAASQMTRLKTGAARIALGVAARRRVPVVIVPCGLTYVHRHRFRSQALVQYAPRRSRPAGPPAAPAHLPGARLGAHPVEECQVRRAFPVRRAGRADSPARGLGGGGQRPPAERGHRRCGDAQGDDGGGAAAGGLRRP